jgi:hypothetical protein
MLYGDLVGRIYTPPLSYYQPLIRVLFVQDSVQLYSKNQRLTKKVSLTLTLELIDLPYKLVFAVGTLDSILIYDTESTMPRHVVTNIHYQPITDLAWKGSQMLAASSSDGYITFISFDKDELGKPVDPGSLPEKLKDIYSIYTSCDINANVVSANNSKIWLIDLVTNIVKPKKRVKPEDQDIGGVEDSNVFQDINSQINETSNIGNRNVTSNIDIVGTGVSNNNNIQEVNTQGNTQGKRRITPQILK